MVNGCFAVYPPDMGESICSKVVSASIFFSVFRVLDATICETYLYFEYFDACLLIFNFLFVLIAELALWKCLKEDLQ